MASDQPSNRVMYKKAMCQCKKRKEGAGGTVPTCSGATLSHFTHLLTFAYPFHIPKSGESNKKKRGSNAPGPRSHASSTQMRFQGTSYYVQFIFTSLQ